MRKRKIYFLCILCCISLMSVGCEKKQEVDSKLEIEKNDESKTDEAEKQNDETMEKEYNTEYIQSEIIHPTHKNSKDLSELLPNANTYSLDLSKLSDDDYLEEMVDVFEISVYREQQGDEMVDNYDSKEYDTYDEVKEMKNVFGINLKTNSFSQYFTIGFADEPDADKTVKEKLISGSWVTSAESVRVKECDTIENVIKYYGEPSECFYYSVDNAYLGAEVENFDLIYMNDDYSFVINCQSMNGESVSVYEYFVGDIKSYIDLKLQTNLGEYEIIAPTLIN